MTIYKELEEEFVEEGANLEHDRWARWQSYMFSKGVKGADGSLLIPRELVERWFRQIDTKYADLPEKEKESDRKETRNYLPLLKANINKVIDECIGEEKIIGEHTYCKTCDGHIAAGECDCIGYNLKRKELLEYKKQFNEK